MNRGKVYLIGAGPGDIALVTLKAKSCVENADCIVYDRLIPKELLEFANKRAELIYLGKENFEGGELQEKINRVLVEKALEGKTVARVKGGDPFVFGRGGEEIQALLEKNIEFEVVPGVTSAIAVPAYAGIPVTHRGISKSFHIFTGHTMEGGEWHDFEPIAKLEGTLIFLMGVKNLHKIVGGLVKNGKSIDTPVAIIEKGATLEQRVTLGTFNNIVDVALARDVKSPAIIVVGDVINFRENFQWFEKKIEQKRSKVLITRDIVQAPEFKQKLNEVGVESKIFPLLEIKEHLIDFNEENLKKYRVILFNSPNGVKFFMEKIKDLRCLSGIKVGAVGSKTEELLKTFKIVPDFVPEKYLVSELAQASVKYSDKGDKILVVTSDISPCDEEKWSNLYEREYHRLVTYTTKKIRAKRDELLESLKEIKYITFLSSSTVDAFWESMEEDLNGTEKCKFVSIGPVTSETMRKYGMRVDLEAKNYDIQGIVDVIRSDFDVFENKKN